MAISWFKNIIEKIKITFDFRKVNSPTTKIGRLNIQIDQKYISSYRHRYFSGSPYLLTNDHNNTEEERQVLSLLDRAKRKADDSLTKNVGKGIDSGRLREINHYVFKIYRDLWFIQKQWYGKRGIYYQGIKTMPDAPEYKRDSKIVVPYNLNDQTDDWEDIGYLEEYAPVQLECHPYNGPSGQGFTIMTRVNIDGDIWTNRLHYGPEKDRNCNQGLQG